MNIHESKSNIISLFQIQQKAKKAEEKISKPKTQIIKEETNKFNMDTKSFFKYYCKICLKDKDKDMFNTFEIAKKFLTHKLDLTYYLKMIDHINRMKNLILKPYQIFMLDHQKKINLLSSDEKLMIDIMDNEKICPDNELHLNFIQTIVQKLKDKCFDPIDNMLFENIDKPLKKLIDDLYNMPIDKSH
jgi:hypothetical protein